jgi:hypothetical protein
VAVVAICHEFMPTILANVFSWGASMSTVTSDADRGVDGHVDGHAPHRVLVAVDASASLAAATAAASRVSGWS